MCRGGVEGCVEVRSACGGGNDGGSGVEWMEVWSYLGFFFGDGF